MDLKEEKQQVIGRETEEQGTAHLLISGPYFPIEIQGFLGP